MSSQVSSDVLTVAALGQPFTLGMLYDARNHKLIPGFTPWDSKATQKNTITSPNRSNRFQVTGSDTIESRSSLLDIDTSLKVSFFAGLIEVGGSACYLNDQKTSRNQSRVTFQYHATTHFKQLSVTSLDPLDHHQMETIEMGLATHVVTGIQYGANAFFVFDSEKMEESKVREIQGSMEAVIKKIPLFEVEGKVEIKLTDEEKALTNKFSCKFYGDLLLESNPVTFEEAVRTYADLPKRLGVNGQNATPLRVWLLPLKILDSTTAGLISEVSIGLVWKIEDTLQDLQQVTMRCNDSLADQVVQNFPDLCKILSRFQTLCNYYIASLRQAVKKELPAIRKGTQDESSLLKVFQNRDQSLFSHDKLSKWLDDKEREITIIHSCVDMMKGTNAKMVQNRSELDREIFSPGVTDVLCFIFTSLETSNPVLDEMSKYRDSTLLAEDPKGPWFFSSDVITRMRLKARAFSDMAKGLKSSSSVKFLLMASANDKYQGASIYHYKEGVLVTDDFSKPKLPPVEGITDKSALMWYTCDLTLNENTVSNCLVLSLDNRKVTREGSQTRPNLPEKFKSSGEKFKICPQVLCSQALTGRCYWEAELSDGNEDYIAVGITYKRIPRKGDNLECYLGRNELSWCFGIKASENKAFIRHARSRDYKDQPEDPVPLPSTGLRRVGVFLDWPAGTLSFYKVSHESLSHLYTFKDKFTEPVYPSCYIESQFGSVLLGPVE